MRYSVLLLGWLAVAGVVWDWAFADPRVPVAETPRSRQLGDTPVAVGSLEVGDVLLVEYRSSGCYHDTRAALRFRRTEYGSIEVTVTAHDGSLVVPIDNVVVGEPTGPQGSTVNRRRSAVMSRLLTTDEVHSLDAMLNWYQLLRERGFCTTVMEFRVRRYRGSVLLGAMAVEDASCSVSLVQGYVTFGALAAETLRDARAQDTDQNLGSAAGTGLGDAR